MSVITEIVSMGQENISNLATCFAKHSEAVCKKHCVQLFSEKEAAGLATECIEPVKTSSNQSMSENRYWKKLK